MKPFSWTAVAKIRHTPRKDILNHSSFVGETTYSGHGYLSDQIPRIGPIVSVNPQAISVRKDSENLFRDWVLKSPDCQYALFLGDSYALAEDVAAPMKKVHEKLWGLYKATLDILFERRLAKVLYSISTPTLTSPKVEIGNSSFQEGILTSKQVDRLYNAFSFIAQDSLGYLLVNLRPGDLHRPGKYPLLTVRVALSKLGKLGPISLGILSNILDMVLLSICETLCPWTADAPPNDAAILDWEEALSFDYTPGELRKCILYCLSPDGLQRRTDFLTEATRIELCARLRELLSTGSVIDGSLIMPESCGSLMIRKKYKGL